MSKKENHLTEKQLIEYQFKLTSGIRTEEIAAHLESCAKCRDHLEKLKRKFEDVKVSEELISQVVKQTKKLHRTPYDAAPAKIFSLGKPIWLSAAAVLLIGLLLIINTGKDERQLNETSNVSTPQTIQMTPAEESESKLVADMQREDTTKTIVASARTKTDKTGEPSLLAEAEVAAAGQITEQPPFAPASAIELVTLPRRDGVQLTIYNSADLTLVRERRNITLKKGWNWLQFMWADTLIDPTSLSLEPLEQKDKIDIQQLVFPARLRELGRWLIHSQISGRVPFEITYFTSGLSWRAFYMGTFSQDEKSMSLKGYVRVTNNSGEDYQDAQTRLIVGQVHILDQIAELARRQYPYGSPIVSHDKKAAVGGIFEDEIRHVTDKIEYGFKELEEIDGLGLKEITKEGLSEYFLYTIEGTETIPNQWSKRLLSFKTDDIEIQSLYKYDEQRWANQTIRFVKFTNDKDHNLGETPIPDGNIKIYGRADSQGHLSYVGGTNIKYIPVNEEVELNLGPARLVKVEPKLMDFKTENYVFDPNDNITGWDELRTWKTEVTNTRTLPVEIEITRNFGTMFWTLQSGLPYEKYDITRARFNLTIEPRSKRSLEYTVRTYHGTREDAIKQ
jgi:hypothetical protein